ncbi:MAG: hypothetical protein M0027_14675, partial [Candidatus Dormibacteraeota bacterium]|nr:hypothetical protein [Candidatus Dormibacteraeota bacterium]
RVRLMAAAAGAAAVETHGDWITVRFDPGHRHTLSDFVAGMPSLAEAGTNRLRFNASKAGGGWPDLLLTLLRRMARARSEEGMAPVGVA